MITLLVPIKMQARHLQLFKVLSILGCHIQNSYNWNFSNVHTFRVLFAHPTTAFPGTWNHRITEPLRLEKTPRPYY